MVVFVFIKKKIINIDGVVTNKKTQGSKGEDIEPCVRRGIRLLPAP